MGKMKPASKLLVRLPVRRPPAVLLMFLVGKSANAGRPDGTIPYNPKLDL